MSSFVSLDKKGGFSLISTLVATAIISIAFFALVSLQVAQQREVKTMKPSLSSASLKALIMKLFVSPELCGCHFDATQNTSIPAGSSLTIDTTIPSRQEIDLGSLRKGCDFSSVDNILLESGSMALSDPHLVVDSVKVSDILFTGTEDRYSGNLVVQYDQESFVRALPGISVPLIFYIDSNSGLDSTRPIQRCWSETASADSDSVNTSLGDLSCYNVGGDDVGELPKALVGCGGTTNITGGEVTAFGFNAGSNTTGNSNTFMGYKAGHLNTSGTKNTFFGFQAGEQNSEGSQNVFVGYRSGVSNETGINNTVLGYQAGYLGESGANNVLVGYRAGYSNQTSKNTFIGAESGLLNSSYINTFIGTFSGVSNQTGEKSTFIGYQSGKNNLSGNQNTFIGFNSGKGNTTGSENTFIGELSGASNVSGNSNTLIGPQSGSSNTSGSENTFIGIEAGAANQDQDLNTFIGYRSGYSNTEGHLNTYVGSEAGFSNTSGADNTFLGYRAGMNNTVGASNTFIGNQAGLAVTEGSKNVFIGTRAGYNVDVGDLNVFIGYESGKENTSGSYNTFIGTNSGWSNISGEKNTFIGQASGKFANSDLNVFIGRYSGQEHGSGNYNTFIGANSGRQIGMSGSGSITENTFVGFKTGFINTHGSQNTFIGSTAGTKNITGSGNTFIGYKAGEKMVVGNQNIFIGAYAGANNNYLTGSNQFVVGNRNHRDWLVGDMDSSGNLYVNGSPVLVQSSRALKKHIKPVTDFKMALNDIIRIPLFTYFYKDEEGEGRKMRMGIISEELPQHLQIKSKDRLSFPDWPSIYGSIWAGIKALYEVLEDVKKNFLLQFESLELTFNSLKAERTDLSDNIQKARSKINETRNEILKVKREIELIDQFIQGHSDVISQKFNKIYEPIERQKYAN